MGSLGSSMGTGSVTTSPKPDQCDTPHNPWREGRRTSYMREIRTCGSLGRRWKRVTNSERTDPGGQHPGERFAAPDGAPLLHPTAESALAVTDSHRH